MNNVAVTAHWACWPQRKYTEESLAAGHTYSTVWGRTLSIAATVHRTIRCSCIQVSTHTGASTPYPEIGSKPSMIDLINWGE